MFTALRLTCLAALLCGFVFIVGCATPEAQPSGFLKDPDEMTRDSTAPFQRTYWNSKFDKAAYTEVVVAPVNTHYLAAQNFWEQATSANITPDQIKKDIADIAQYTRNSFIRAIADDPNRRFKVVDKAGPKALILEVAITQLVPSKPALNAIGYVSWIPTAVAVGSSVVTDSPDAGKGYVAIEGRVRDGATGEIIGMFADRKAPPMAIVDLKALNWWAPAKAIIDGWSKNLVTLANRRPGQVVKDAPSFQLMVW